LARRKIRKKDLKKPDEFIATSARITAWCRDNMRIVAGAIGSILLLILIVGGVIFFKAQRESKARALYEAALVLYPTETSRRATAEEYTAVVARLEEVKNRYGSTTVGTNASVDLGNAYFQTQNYDKAISCYSDFLKRTDSKNALHDLVLESLGETYEAKGSYEEALEVYQRLARESAPIYQVQAQLYLGRVYEAIGDQNKATSHYENYLNENPVTLFSEQIRTKLMRWRKTADLKEQG
jgi:tetratricopeptide (TPR) repeat protein